MQIFGEMHFIGALINQGAKNNNTGTFIRLESDPWSEAGVADMFMRRIS